MLYARHAVFDVVPHLLLHLAKLMRALTSTFGIHAQLDPLYAIAVPSLVPHLAELPAATPHCTAATSR